MENLKKKFATIIQCSQEASKRVPSNDSRPSGLSLQQERLRAANQLAPSQVVVRSMNPNTEEQQRQALAAANMLMNAHNIAIGLAPPIAGTRTSMTLASRNQAMAGDSQSVGSSQQTSVPNLVKQSIQLQQQKKNGRRYQSTDKYAAQQQPAATSRVAANMLQVQQQYMARGSEQPMSDLAAITQHAAQQQRQKSGDHRQAHNIMMHSVAGAVTGNGLSSEQGGLKQDNETIPMTLQEATPPKVDVSQIIKFGETKFSDYTRMQQLGVGTYGEVHRCIHMPSGIDVAMKTFKFDNVQNGINYSTMREISILKSLKDEPYFVKILDVIKDEHHKEKLIYCIFEYCPSTLAKFFTKQKDIPPLETIQRLMKQLLTAVDTMHAKMILHRDIKPDNILLDKEGNIKVADFGLAKKASFMQRRKSNTIVSLWYRAPEIVLGSDDYLLGVDIWSMGCIFAEFYTGKPVFQVRGEEEALDRAFQILGYPTKQHSPHLLELPTLKRKFPALRQYEIKPLSSYFTQIDSPLALDLLSKLLALDPRERITAKEALRHDFFKPVSRREQLQHFDPMQQRTRIIPPSKQAAGVGRLGVQVQKFSIGGAAR